MRITKIHVSNFKSFREETITFDHLNILIGSNASGKSNTISIFRFLDQIIDYGLENAISLSGGIEYVLNTTIGKSMPLNMSFSFSCEDEDWIMYVGKKREDKLLFAGFDYSFEITPHKRGSGYRITKDTITIYYFQVIGLPKGKKNQFDSQKVYKQFYRRINGKITYELENKTDYIDNEEMTNGLESIFVKKFFDARENRSELILHFISIFMPPMFFSRDLVRIYDFDPKLMKKSSSLTSVSHLEEDGSNLANILQNLLKTKFERNKLENILSDCLPFIERISTESNFDKSISYKIKENYSQKPLYANFLSDGTVSVLALIIALNFEKDAGTIIIEEPERNLHPFLMNRLIEMARETSKERQIIITTHTPELIKHANINDILFASRCQEGFSCISRPADNDMVQEFLKNEVGIDSLFVQNLLGE